jgi:acyl-coenzyme A thioesterase PaaI-like protein
MTKRTSSFRPELTAEVFNSRSRGHLPGLAGVEILTVAAEAVKSRMSVRREVMAPNGFLHASSVIALADTSCGYGCVAHLPEGASGFTTVELNTTGYRLPAEEQFQRWAEQTPEDFVMHTRGVGPRPVDVIDHDHSLMPHLERFLEHKTQRLFVLDNEYFSLLHLNRPQSATLEKWCPLLQCFPRESVRRAL